MCVLGYYVDECVWNVSQQKEDWWWHKCSLRFMKVLIAVFLGKRINEIKVENVRMRSQTKLKAKHNTLCLAHASSLRSNGYLDWFGAKVLFQFVKLYFMNQAGRQFSKVHLLFIKPSNQPTNQCAEHWRIRLFLKFRPCVDCVSLLTTSMFSFRASLFYSTQHLLQPIQFIAQLPGIFIESLMPLIHCVVVDTKLNK